MAYTDWMGTEGLNGLMGSLNTNSEGLWGVVVWFLAYFILWVVFTSSSARGGSQEPAKDGFMVSSLVMAMVSMLLAAMTPPFIPVYLSAVPIILSVVGIIILARKND